jgi:hypothetical protein
LFGLQETAVLVAEGARAPVETPAAAPVVAPSAVPAA